ncbi:3'-5' exonuclease [Bacillus thuringiensis]|uniref:3'-5' exonuclease n=1 Tax=Bacillus cereus group TaxID=86661 RepID=UPI000CD9E4E8|nr:MULTISPECIES: 3'-5' exonuclease [Bacillus cereus group]MEC3420534.1 3'-5' exonuclease [Bacillus cereus]MEC3596944.1 3'-5' exonuclease [Bacillus thuringiensis]MED1574293.1 3'-5' exonuclease [Bacillus paranthracis]MED1836217.1 3'-5' exonuclease [Bacillus thuringiensis]MED2670280.1 3'-5' exonuclease [Bacillus thuringiensis]
MFTVLDFETTGLNYNEEQVIEIAAKRLNDKLEVTEEFHTMVRLNEGKELSPFIMNLTGITPADLKHGMIETEAMELLKRFIGDSVVVAQFASFDLSFLSKWLLPKQYICTRSLSRLINPTEKAGLADLVKRYDVKLDGHHRAMNDVDATIEVFKIMKSEADEKGIEYMNTIIDSKERPLMYLPLYVNVVFM